MTRKQAEQLPAWAPWRSNAIYGPNDYRNWYEWMTTRGDSQRFVWDMKSADAMRLYDIMSQMAWDCHLNHPAIEKDVAS